MRAFVFVVMGTLAALAVSTVPTALVLAAVAWGQWWLWAALVPACVSAEVTFIAFMKAMTGALK